MKYTKQQILINVIAGVPFIIGTILLIYGMVTLKNISMMPAFNLNWSLIFVIGILHIFLIFFLLKWKNIDMGHNQMSRKKNATVITCLIIGAFCSSTVLVMSIKMNINYWMKSNTTSEINVIIENKRISSGRSTTYYIDLISEGNEYYLEVSKSSFRYYDKGDSYLVKVNKGYFEGCFLTKKIK
ncbi:MAG: putative membrane protein [Flavobacteriales bacterium]|jgi:uncharacterized membrane protein